MGDLTKSAITIASVDRFYLNLVICNIAFQNSVKIWHCLQENYDNVYRGLLFPGHSVYTVSQKIVRYLIFY